MGLSCTQLAECLPSMFKTPDSDPSVTHMTDQCLWFQKELVVSLGFIGSFWAAWTTQLLVDLLADQPGLHSTILFLNKAKQNETGSLVLRIRSQSFSSDYYSSAVKRTGCSSKGPGLSSQQPHSNSSATLCSSSSRGLIPPYLGTEQQLNI